MKQKKIMIYKINNILLIFILISSLSCKSQVIRNNLNCKDYFDIQGVLFKKDCFNGKKLYRSFYFYKNGHKTKICSNPDKEATIFNNNDSSYNAFVLHNLERPNCEGEGKVFIALFIDNYGNVIEKRIFKSIPGGCEGFNESVMNLISKIPKWEPAEKKGRNVKSIKILSIKF